MARRLTTSLLFLFYLSVSSAHADIVGLHNGRQLHGKILEENTDVVLLEVPNGTVKLQKPRVAWVMRGSDEMIEKKLKTADFFKKGQILFQKHYYHEAARSFEEASELEPTSVEIWNNLGTAYAADHNNEKALGAFEQAVTIAPGNPTVLENLANANMSARQYQQAAKLLHGMLMRSADKGKLYLKLSVVFYKNRKYAQAGKVYRVAKKLGAVKQLLPQGG